MSAIEELHRVIGWWEEGKENPSTATLTIRGDTLKEIAAEFAALTESNAILLEALKEVLSDLETGFIAQNSHRGDVRRKKLELMIRAAIAQVEKK